MSYPLIEDQIVEAILTKKLAPKEQLDSIVERSRQRNHDFKEQLLKSDLIKEQDFQKIVASIFKLPYLDKLPDASPELRKHCTEKIALRFLKKFLCYPYLVEANTLFIAVADIYPSFPYEQLALELGYDMFSITLTKSVEIINVLNRTYDRSAGSAEEAAEILEEDEDLLQLSELGVAETEDLLDVDDEEPIKRLMNSILFQTLKDGASDVHVTPLSKETLVRNRIDGVLHLVTKVPRAAHMPLINRIKVMSKLDISVKNQPQDGRSMVMLAGKKVDIRVSIIPTAHGEQAVLRLLHQGQGLTALSEVGMPQKVYEALLHSISQPHGIVLVTGPTGSGKTTTLYSALQQINAEEKNIVTIEDPVEYQIDLYGQMQVNEKLGVTFAKGLRAMLRQDPDIIMVGEMRDAETSQIAIQSALTGHLVFSTLHTNDSASSVVRLIDMGIEPFLVSSTVTAILAQRLVRKICDKCRAPVPYMKEELLQMDFPEDLLQDYQGVLYAGNGCEECRHTGYKGRVGIFELLQVSDNIRQGIMRGDNAAQLRSIALKENMITLRYACCEKILQGLTTIDEMYRVVFTDMESKKS